MTRKCIHCGKEFTNYLGYKVCWDCRKKKPEIVSLPIISQSYHKTFIDYVRDQNPKLADKLLKQMLAFK